jgi:hypothetical protein
VSAVGVDTSAGADVNVGSASGVDVAENAVAVCVTAIVVGSVVVGVSTILSDGGEEDPWELQPASQRTARNGIITRFIFIFTDHLN